MPDFSPPNHNPVQPLLGIVGVCASGKTSLVARLRAQGITVKHIAQEHSYVKDMWKRIANPVALVFLDASYPVTLKRRQFNWSEAEWAEQQRRLSHAREHADLHIDTDELTVEQVFEIVMSFIQNL